jgi:hypothetical protein
MPRRADLPKFITTTARFAMVAASLTLLLLLPNQVLAILAAWALASLPIGVLIGHCVLSEESPPRTRA